MTPLQHTLCFGLRIYQLVFSPILSALFGPLGFGCRYLPTCSGYALDAVKTHGVLKGSILAAGRVCRCHPWGRTGYDPVPPLLPTQASADESSHAVRTQHPITSLAASH